jgi:bifunctional UDP-N-acetylglucosamine pyrophosphorylase/glucosamine-1-phosphate N-acetyltransferase
MSPGAHQGAGRHATASPPTAAVVLAAGEGKRMRGGRAKVLHEVAGKPLLGHVLDRLDELGIGKRVIVVGHQREEVAAYGRSRGATLVVQEDQLGTAHALRQAVPALGDFRGRLLVLCGDMPLLTAATLERLLSLLEERQAAAAVLSAVLPDATGYGRVLRDAAGDIERIVEHADATPAEREVREINTAIYAFRYPEGVSDLERVRPENRQGEYYLTDLVTLLRARGERVTVLRTPEPREALGVNTLKQLAEAEAAMAALRAEGRL